jgi:hypothetical protein
LYIGILHGSKCHKRELPDNEEKRQYQPGDCVPGFPPDNFLFQAEDSQFPLSPTSQKVNQRENGNDNTNKIEPPL